MGVSETTGSDRPHASYIVSHTHSFAGTSLDQASCRHLVELITFKFACYGSWKEAWPPSLNLDKSTQQNTEELHTFSTQYHSTKSNSRVPDLNSLLYTRPPITLHAILFLMLRYYTS